MSPSSDHQASDSNQNQKNPLNLNSSNLSNQLSDSSRTYQRVESIAALPNIPLPLPSTSTSNSNFNSNLNRFDELSNSYKSSNLTPNFNQFDKNHNLENSNKSNEHSTQRIPILKHQSSLSSKNQLHPQSFQSFSSRLHQTGLSGSPRELNIENLTDEQKARIVKRHLMNKDEQDAARRITSSSKLNDDAIDQFDPASMDSDEPNSNRDSDAEPSGSQEAVLYPTPYHLQGGDIHHDVYKWANKFPSGVRLSQSGDSRPTNLALSRTRSVSISGTSLRISEPGTATAINDTPSDSAPAMAYKDIMQPGGFRRAFLYQKRQMIGEPYNAQNDRKFTKSFIDFLSLYGHFGGEDLEEIDEQDEAAYHALQGLHDLEDGDFDDEQSEGQVGERSALLGKSTRKVSSQRSRPIPRRSTSRHSDSKHPGFSRGSSGDATVTQAVLMLLKSLVGTGVLFLAKAFSNGGMLFSILTLVFISMISTYSFVLLVRTRLQIPGGFGEIGGILYGPWLRWAILSSLVISQLGFVAAYTIFIAQNLQAFVLAITNCKLMIPIYVLIFGQLIAYLPLSMIRNIQKLSGTALIADVFILVGLLYVFGYEINLMATVGVAPIKAFNPESFPLLIGTAVFAFEGIGLVPVLTGVMVGLTFLFAGAGALGYAAFGSDVQTVVIVNLPQEDKMVNAVQFLYSMAIMLSTPLQLFPAVRIMENGLFSTSGKYSNKVKWEKNLFRTLTVIFCSFIAWAGASDLDKFVSLIGSVACVPLCFCYPAMLHYRARAKTLKQKIADIALFIFGILAAIYTTAQTLSIIFGDIENGNGDGPKFGNCDVVP
ncbi:transmembrane amino acid transporter protein-domain-containing protein [Melampsora americana]|nr:transmembrane amino acid transporter protein-domain-containing protein [Melampsora americana]